MKTPSSSSLPSLAPATSEVHRVPTDTRQAPRMQGHDSAQSALTPVQPPRDDNPFEEFMWMENEEEYNEQVMFVSTFEISLKGLIRHARSVLLQQKGPSINMHTKWGRVGWAYGGMVLG